MLNTKETVIEIKECLNRIRSYSKDIIHSLRKSDMWKTQLTIANNFTSSINNHEERLMHSKSDNMKILISDEADEVIKKLFHSLKNRYQSNLESKKRRDFFFDYVYLLYYKCHKINSNSGGLYTNYPDCIKKKVIINSKNRKR